MSLATDAPAPAAPPAIDWPRVARLVLTSRLIDTIEEQELTPAGLVAYQFSAKGHELAQVLLGLSLRHPHDAAAVYYRSRPFMLASGFSIEEAFVGGMAKTGSLSEGRDTGVSYFLPPRQGVTILPMSGNVGAQYSPSAGWAQAILYRRDTLGEADWIGALSVALGGDGSTAANGFWAAINIASTLRLPMLFFIEDNGYAISVPGSLQNARGNIAASLAAFAGLRVIDGDGTDPASAPALLAEALNYVRAGNGPALLRLSVVRLTGHSFTDNQAYKSAEALAAEAARDPLVRLRSHLPALDWGALEYEVARDVRAGLAAAQESLDPDPASAAHHVFYQGLPQRVGGLLAEGVQLPAGSPAPATASGPRINLVDAVRRVLDAELAVNPRALVFGEDVGVKGGVHGATLDLQLKYGAARVFDTSLSEDGIIGRAVGLAYAGLLPVPEIQFRKYADPATEQLNDTGWIRWRTAGKFAAPMVVRIPVGFGKKTGDPWHSVTGEAVFAHTLGWRLAFPSNAADAVGLLRSALRGHDPTFFFEHRALLDTAPGRRPYPGDDYVLPFGQAAVVQDGDRLTVVTWGEMVHRCLEAAQSWPGQVEVIDLRTIVPWDREAVLASVRRTGHCLVVHEDTLTGGFAAEIVATIASEAFTDLDGPVLRVAASDCPVPYSPGLTQVVIPSVAVVAARMAELLAF
ncbi:MAG: pyruvate dehydrogenase [Anaerolineales bacterium]|nr:pyruvate dehydrogenase [Anaerolineales bacterium]